MDSVVPSDILPYVHTFLVQNTFHKTAKALRKECKTLVPQNCGSEANLVEWYTFYHKSHAGNRTVVVGNHKPPPKKRRKKGKHEEGCGQPGGEEGCGQPGDEEVCGQPGDAIKNTRKRKWNQLEENVVQSSEVKGQGRMLKDVVKVTPKKEEMKVANRKNKKLSVDGNVDEMECKSTSNEMVLNGRGSATSESSDSDGVMPSDKSTHDVTNTNGKVTPTTHPLDVQSPSTFPAPAKNKKKVKFRATPFRRVGDEVEVDSRLNDNSFEAKFNSLGSWGERANKDLKFTKGKSFRHEKTKKKRGTYKGGAIDTSICSIKFDSD